MNPLTQHNREIRILVVDDYEPWRQQIRSILQTRPTLRIVAEVADGLEAVQKAQELRPDSVLLDIGLPHLNGLQASAQIHQAVPETAILFVTQNDDAEMAEAALSNGAKGYLLKADAGKELWLAIEAVLQGKKFVSNGLRR